MFKQGISFVLEYILNKIYKNKSRHIFFNNLSSAKFFGFVSHFKSKYTILV